MRTAMLCGLAGALLLVGRAAAADAWTVLYPLHQPVSLELPMSWSVTAPSGVGEKFDAQTVAGADVVLNVVPFTGSWSRFVATEKKRARQAYLTQDPHAKLRLEVVTLPGGTALHASVRLVRRSNARLYHLAVEDWVFLRRGRSYEFAYTAFVRPADSLMRVFARSARSIQFKR